MAESTSPILGLDSFLVVARSSLLVTLVTLHADVALLLFVASMTLVLFLNERLLRTAWPWLLMAGVLGVAQAQTWWLVDDHVVAATYWLGAIGASRFAQQPGAVLALTGRLMIAVIFSLAFGWKLLSSQYTSGDFFEYTLLRDPRFEPIAVLVGGADEDGLEADRVAVSDFTQHAELDEQIVVSAGPRTREVALGLTWYGLAIEGAVAAAFVLPLRARWRLLRPMLLIVFCVTTYTVVPVTGFALLLLAMGFAHEGQAAARRAYLAAGVYVFVWNTVLAGLIL